MAKEKLESFDDIRMMLSDIATKVLSGEMPASQANAGVNAIGKIITSVKVEGEIRRVVGNIKGALPLQLKGLEIEAKAKGAKE